MAKPIQKTITENFQTDNTGVTPGWNFTAGSGYVAGAYFSRQGVLYQPSHRPSAPAATYRGCLRATCRKNGTDTESYWEYTGTWENLGVPKGSVVNSVSMDYNYRWQCQDNDKHKAVDNLAVFTGTNTGFGPVTLRDSGGTSLGTISNRVTGIDRVLVTSQWACYPNGVNDGRAIDGDNGWLKSTGTPLTVLYPNANSSKTIKLRIEMRHPSVSTGLIIGQHAWMRMKIDKVVLTIQHSQGTSFFAF